MTKNEAINKLEEAVSKINVDAIMKSAMPELAFGFEINKNLDGDFDELEAHVPNEEFAEIIVKIHPNHFKVEGVNICLIRR